MAIAKWRSKKVALWAWKLWDRVEQNHESTHSRVKGLQPMSMQKYPLIAYTAQCEGMHLDKIQRYNGWCYLWNVHIYQCRNSFSQIVWQNINVESISSMNPNPMLKFNYKPPAPSLYLRLTVYNRDRRLFECGFSSRKYGSNLFRYQCQCCYWLLQLVAHQGVPIWHYEISHTCTCDGTYQDHMLWRYSGASRIITTTLS